MVLGVGVTPQPSSIHRFQSPACPSGLDMLRLNIAVGSLEIPASFPFQGAGDRTGKGRRREAETEAKEVMQHKGQGLFFRGTKWLNLSTLDTLKLVSVGFKGIVRSAAGDSRPGSQKRRKEIHIHMRLLPPANLSRTRETHGDLARKCLARHPNALSALQIASLMCWAPCSLPSCFVLEKCHIF